GDGPERTRLRRLILHLQHIKVLSCALGQKRGFRGPLDCKQHLSLVEITEGEVPSIAESGERVTGLRQFGQRLPKTAAQNVEIGTVVCSARRFSLLAMERIRSDRGVVGDQGFLKTVERGQDVSQVMVDVGYVQGVTVAYQGCAGLLVESQRLSRM